MIITKASSNYPVQSFDLILGSPIFSITASTRNPKMVELINVPLICYCTSPLNLKHMCGTVRKPSAFPTVCPCTISAVVLWFRSLLDEVKSAVIANLLVLTYSCHSAIPRNAESCSLSSLAHILVVSEVNKLIVAVMRMKY